MVENYKSVYWERVLYRKFNYPDNYSDEMKFLKLLKRNVNVVHYTLPESMRGACTLMGHVNVIVLYLCIFEYVQMRILEIQALTSLIIAISIICVISYIIFEYNTITFDICIDQLYTLVTILLFGYGFTPIIRTLTTSISTDSIYATSFILFFFSLVFHDYGLESPVVRSNISVNLALSASVFLISRVKSDELAFSLLALALCVFCFWPLLRNLISSRPFWNIFLPISLIILLGPLSIMVISIIEIPLAIIHALLHIFLIVICPILLTKMQHYKSTIHGPWDEASLKPTTKTY